MRSGAVFRLQSASTRAVESAVASGGVSIVVVVLGAVAVSAYGLYCTSCCCIKASTL